MTILLKKYKRAVRKGQFSTASRIEQEIIEAVSNENWSKRDRIIEALTLASI